MANGNGGSSNTAIVAILVIIILAIALLYYTGIFGNRGERGSTTNIFEKTETPRTETFDRSSSRSSSSTIDVNVPSSNRSKD